MKTRHVNGQFAKRSVVVEAEVFDSISDAARYLASECGVSQPSRKTIDNLSHQISYACNHKTRPDYYWNV